LKKTLWDNKEHFKRNLIKEKEETIYNNGNIAKKKIFGIRISNHKMRRNSINMI